ncbi:MAG: winged helix-turn-helix domain-containing protein [Acidobacteria bacterium]|nr:winged helix-turn-helix domain-containing protein [Acidobacteriota bacterium]MBS1866946.1 winged helix-turn-helix domain-containing protein [Acidobacteriota bacterium]
MAEIRQSQIARFGVFELNVQARELRKHGVRVRLSGQPFAILEILLQNPGSIVSREDLQNKLWKTDTFVDFEHGLNSAIKKLRSALGDTPENSRYIETIPRVGYRFIAPLELLSAEAKSDSSAQQAGGTWQSGLGRWLLLAGIGLFVVTAVVVYLKWTRTPPAQTASARVMIAVLPFENLTGDAAQDYFSDGLTEEMIARLGKIDPQRLGVIARSSVEKYKHQPANLEQIKRELSVQYVLEGTVRRDTERVRVTAKLIQMKDQADVWSREYDRSLDKVIALQGEIAEQLASGLLLRLDRSGRPVNVASLSPSAYESYDLYLKGRFFWNKRNEQGFERAKECFKQAIDKDPNNARAYAGLADAYSLIGSYRLVPVEEIRKQAWEAARKATQLDPNLAEAHTSLAVIAQNFDWDWATAEKEYRRAIELDPNYATAHHWYAEELALVGRFDESLAEIERARQLDPMSLIIATDRAAILYFARQYDKSIEQFRTVLEMDPYFPRARIVEAVYAQKHMYAEALADSDEWMRTGEGVWSWGIRGYLYGRTNQREKALECEKVLRQKYGNHPALALVASIPYIGMGDKKMRCYGCSGPTRIAR